MRSWVVRSSKVSIRSWRSETEAPATWAIGILALRPAGVSTTMGAGSGSEMGGAESGGSGDVGDEQLGRCGALGGTDGAGDPAGRLEQPAVVRGPRRPRGDIRR